MPVYLDYNATTPVLDDVLDVIVPLLRALDGARTA